MAKGRMISKSISTSEKLLLLGEQLEECGLSEFGQLLYTWTIPHTDDYGRMDASPRILKLKVMPGSARSLKEFQIALNAMEAVGLIYLYQEKKYLEIADNDKHQTYRADRTRRADYPARTELTTCHTTDIPTADNGTSVVSHNLREGKLREGKGREGKECTTYIHTSSADKNAEDESVIDSELEPPDQEQEDPTPEKEEAIPQCPHQAIIDLYHKTLPELPRVRVWNDDQQKALRTRWKDDQQRRNLEWWKLFFELIRGSPFLMGRENGFQADLEWLIRPKNFAKIMNGRYHRQDQGKYTQTGYKNLEVMKSWLKKEQEKENAS